MACKKSTCNAEHIVGSSKVFIFIGNLCSFSNSSEDKSSAKVGASLAGKAYSTSSS